MPQKPKPLNDAVSMRAWFGVELRNWRRARGMSSSTLGSLVHLSSTTIERIEKAERPCNAGLADGMDTALNAGGALRRLWRRVEEDDRHRADADNRMTNVPPDPAQQVRTSAHRAAEATRAEEVPQAVERRRLLAASGAAVLNAANFAGLTLKNSETPLPATVGPEDIEQVWASSRVLAGWDNLYGGGGLVRAASLGQFTWAKRLLDLKCPDALVTDLHTAVGRLAVVLGSSAFDAYEHEDAARLLDFATACAEAAGNWHLRALALNWRARQAIWCGAPDLGVTYAESGLVRADRLTHREQSMLHNARARGWAKMGEHRETLAAIGRSDAIFGNAKDGEDGPWMAYYDNAQHHGDTGHALFDLALLAGRPPEVAAARLKTAIKGHADGYVRSRALSGTKLATLTMATGDPQEAIVIAHRALDEIGRLHSKRAVTDVQALAEASMPHHRMPEVAHLRRRITRVIRA